MPKIQVFDRRDAVYDPYRVVGAGHQSVCEWVSSKDGAPYQAGIAQLERIRIADYVFAFDDFLFVLEGAVIVTDESGPVSLAPGQAVFVPKGTRLTLDVPDRLVWTYVAHGASLHWKDSSETPGAVEEL
ncbi:MAG: cupin domain-containing protein [Pseudomonadota bacterium]